MCVLRRARRDCFSYIAWKEINELSLFKGVKTGLSIESFADGLSIFDFTYSTEPLRVSECLTKDAVRGGDGFQHDGRERVRGRLKFPASVD